MSEVLVTAAERAIPIHAILDSEVAAALDAAPPIARALATVGEFKAKAGQVMVVPDADGGVERVLFGLGAAADLDPMSLRALPTKLPTGDYRIVQAPEGLAPDLAALAFALGSYRFDRYKKKPAERPRLVVEAAHAEDASRQAHACAMARDMVNTPANDMGPLQIETIARELAEQFRGRITSIVGEGLLEANYPAVHAVGRAAAPHRAPRMIEIDWGKAKDPLVVLVGKGVVFDTGGLDIKPSAGMRLMKKDMGGAAHVLALARMIMAAKLPVRLCVLAPVVENAIAGDAMRPGDVLETRKGVSVEVGNTDAEGRLILADALARAAEMEPALTIDMATLTGAARAALGPQLPPYYTDDDDLAAALEAAARAVRDPIWRMPLWKGYADALDSDVADMKNDPDAWAQAGSVTAALFLQRFAPAGPWLHFDIMSWNPRSRPGWPQGAEVQGARAVYRMIRDRFA